VFAWVAYFLKYYAASGQRYGFLMARSSQKGTHSIPGFVRERITDGKMDF